MSAGGPVAPPRFTGLTVRGWFRLVFAAIVVFVLAASAVIAVVLARSRTVSARLNSTIQPAEAQAYLLQLSLLQQQSSVRGYVITREPSFLRPYTDGRKHRGARRDPAACAGGPGPADGRRPCPGGAGRGPVAQPVLGAADQPGRVGRAARPGDRPAGRERAGVHRDPDAVRHAEPASGRASHQGQCQPGPDPGGDQLDVHHPADRVPGRGGRTGCGPEATRSSSR